MSTFDLLLGDDNLVEWSVSVPDVQVRNGVRELHLTNAAVESLYTLAGDASVAVCAKLTSACGNGGPAIAAQMNGPDSVAVDASGRITNGYQWICAYV